MLTENEISELYINNYKRLVTYCNRQLNRHMRTGADAEDVVSEVFRSLTGKDLSHVKCLDAYLTTIARNLCAKHYLATNKAKASESMFSDIILTNGYAESERKINILKKLIPLTGKRNAKLLRLIYIKGVSQEKAAKEMEMDYGSFRMALSRAREKLREVFNTVEDII